jgi:HPt (histidine-containing phosphotransfer) domain-containing protein
VDLQRLADTVDGDRAFEAELVAVYLEDTAARIQRLPNLLAAGDFTALKREAHTLKGSSANVGGVGLSRLALALEHSALAADVPTCTVIIGQVQNEFDVVERTFEVHLARP